MSDNVTNLNVRSAKKTLGRVFLLLLVIVLVCGAVALFVFRDSWNLDTIRRSIRYLDVTDNAEPGKFSFDAHNYNQYAAYGDGMAVSSITGLNTYDKNGAEEAVIQLQQTAPSIRSAGKYVLAFDVGGTGFCEAKVNLGEVLTEQTERPILDADLAPDGCVACSASESGFKSVLYVYSSQQQLIYRWLSSSQYLPLCAVQKGGKHMAAVGLGQKEGMFESSLLLFDTQQEDIENSRSLGNELICDVGFVSDDTICCVGQSQCFWYDLSLNRVGRYGYGGAYLQDFDLSGSGFVTLVMNQYQAGNRCSVLTVDASGTVLGEAAYEKQILDISVCGRYVAVLTDAGLDIYDSQMRIYDASENTDRANRVLMRNDGTAILISGGKGSLYIP